MRFASLTLLRALVVAATLALLMSATTSSDKTAVPVSSQKQFVVIGIEARTSNAKEATADGVIGKQWQRLFGESLLNQVQSRLDSQIYALYTDYESDQNGAYNYVLGAKVAPDAPVPRGMVRREIPEGQYAVFTSERGPVAQVVVETWKRIWAWPAELSRYKRAYKTDFEVHDSSDTPESATVQIHIGVQ